MKNSSCSPSKCSPDKNQFAIQERYVQHLKPFQIEGIRFLHEQYLKNENAILNDDRGLGKTIQAILFVSAIRLSKCLIICEPNDIYHWNNHIKTWSSFTATIYEKNCSQSEFCISSIHSGVCSDNRFWEIIIVDDIDVDHVKSLQKLKCKYKIWLSKENFNVKVKNLYKILSWISPVNLLAQTQFDNNFIRTDGCIEKNLIKWQQLNLYSQRWVLKRTRSMVEFDLPLSSLRNNEIMETNENDQDVVKYITDECKQGSDSSLILIENNNIDIVEIRDSSGSDQCSPVFSALKSPKSKADNVDCNVEEKKNRTRSAETCDKTLNLSNDNVTSQSVISKINQDDDCMIMDENIVISEKKTFKLLDSLLFA